VLSNTRLPLNPTLRVLSYNTLLGRGMDIVVILKICCRQEIILITLLLINKQSEILVKFLINILCLFI